MIDLALAIIFYALFTHICWVPSSIGDYAVMVALYFLTNIISSFIDDLLGIDIGGQ